MIEWLNNPFVLRATIALAILAPLCAMVGIQVVNHRLAFFSDAISHSAFTGVALGVLFHIDPRLTIIVFGLMVGAGIALMKRRSTLALDTVIGVFYSAVVAFGIVVVSARKGLTKDFQQFLYGDVLSITTGEIYWLVVILAMVLMYTFLRFNRLLAVSVHEELAAASGVRVRFSAYLLNFFVALIVVFGIRAVGILLVTALLIVPAAAGRNIAGNTLQMFWWSVVICLSSAMLGLIGALTFDTAIGASIILVATVWFIVTALLGRMRIRA